MTTAYGTTIDGKPAFFRNSQYLVFLNRALSFLIALLLTQFIPQPIDNVALYKV